MYVSPGSVVAAVHLVLRHEALEQLAGLPIPGGPALDLSRNLLQPRVFAQEVPRAGHATSRVRSNPLEPAIFTLMYMLLMVSLHRKQNDLLHFSDTGKYGAKDLPSVGIYSVCDGCISTHEQVLGFRGQVKVYTRFPLNKLTRCTTTNWFIFAC